WRSGSWDDRSAAEPRHRSFEEIDAYAEGVVSIRELSLPEGKDAPVGAGAESRTTSSIAKGELPAQFPSTGSESSRGQTAAPEVESTEEKPLLHKSREDFLAAARRAARKASSESGGAAASARGAGRQHASAGARRASVRPVTGLVVAMLALVLAAGVGLTTYSLYKDGLGETWKLGRSVLELGSSAGGAAGGGAGSEGSPEAAPSQAPQTPPGVIIENPASRPGTEGG